jgi:hypothetical protein
MDAETLRCIGVGALPFLMIAAIIGFFIYMDMFPLKIRRKRKENGDQKSAKKEPDQE